MIVADGSRWKLMYAAVMAVMLGVGILTALQVAVPAPQYDERRSLAPRPVPTWPAIWSGQFFRELDFFVRDRLLREAGCCSPTRAWSGDGART